MLTDEDLIGPPLPPVSEIETPKKSPWTVYFWLCAGLIALLHFGLATAYARVMPYRTPAVSYHQFLPDVGAPDERAHAQVISDLANGKAYPAFDPGRPDFMDRYYQAHQPPLYYAATAGFLKLFRTTDVESQNFGALARALNSLFGALNVLGVAALVWWLFAPTQVHRARLALTTAAIVALVPMNLAVSGSINNDALLFALCTWGWAIVVRTRQVKTRLPFAILAGTLLGLAILTKFSALLALPVALVLALWPGKDRLDWFRTLTVGVIALAFVAPWCVRNLNVYGEPFLTKTFQAAFPPSARNPPETPVRAYRWFNRLVEATQESATGVFGYFDIHYPMWIPVLATWLWIGLATWGGYWAWTAGHRGPLLIGFLAFGLFFAAYAAFNVRYLQPQARYIFPALPFLALLAALGLQRINPRVTAGYIGLYLVLNGATLPWLSFQYWLRTHPDEVAYQAIPPAYRDQFPPPRPVEQTRPLRPLR